MDLLSIQHFSKKYGAELALEINQLSLSKGIYLLSGENGSGKTTFLKALAGLLPFKGELLLNEQYSLTKKRQAYLKHICYAEAEPVYPGFLTAKDLVKYYCNIKNDAIDKTYELLQQLHIADAYLQPLGTYSSGMTKKLSLALAFCGNASCILLDEPLITIDVQAQDVICNLIQLYSSQGVSFIITSHQAFNTPQFAFSGFLEAKNKTINIVP